MTRRRSRKWRLSLTAALFLLALLNQAGWALEPMSKSFYDEKGQIIREEVDSTGSGKIDTWITYKDGKPILQAVDTDKDGKPDTWYHIGSDGQVARAEKDRNGDGKADIWITYQQGMSVRQEQDLDFDGRPDLFIYYEGGKPVRAEESLKRDGKITLWSYYDGAGILIRDEEDTKGLGQIGRASCRERVYVLV